MKFKVIYEPDEGGWLARIPKVQGCRTWGRSLAEARRHIREALSVCVDVFPDPDKVAAEAELEDDVRLPAAARKAVDGAARARVRADDLATALREQTTAAACALLDAGLSLRDAGELLGLSQERVRQITAKPAPAHGKRPRRAA
jgi:predicted RNase H-like HicB family nuclease